MVNDAGKDTASYQMEFAMNETKEQPYNNNDLGVLFHRIAKMMARSYHKHSHAHHAQAHIFSIVRERGSINQRELMKTLDIRSSSLSELLKKLELRGLIERTRDEHDKRGYIISVAEGVENPFPEITRKDQPAREEFFATLENKEKEQLGTLLEKIIHSAHEHGHEEVECKHSHCHPEKHHHHHKSKDKRRKIKHT